MRLLIWGTGELAWQTIEKINVDDIVGFIDSYRAQENEIFAGKPVYTPDEVKRISYDAILVSTIYGDEVSEESARQGIPDDRLIFVYGNILTKDRNLDYSFVEKICGRSFSDLIRNRYHLVREIDKNLLEKPAFDINQFKETKKYRSDYIRLKAFELIAREIFEGKIPGQTAEFGVFRGDFAQIINAAFYDRKLYLFDTFEGFPDGEIDREMPGDTGNAMKDAYRKTCVDIVISKMRHPEQIVIHKGFFPESLNGLEEDFAFVSIDCDWEESIYQGLVYFYPRLCNGGYIMIHDYNNNIACAKRAIKRYEDKLGDRIVKVPIPDAGGSVVLAK